MHEQMILSLEDMVSLFENRYTLGMLTRLESHMITINKFRLNPSTSLDFCLHFVMGMRVIFEEEEPVIEAERLVQHCLPLLHFSAINYQLSRKKYSEIAIAAVCFKI